MDGTSWLYGASGLSGLDWLFVLEIGIFTLVCLGLGWLMERSPAIARWMAFREVRQDLDLKIADSEVKRAAKARVLGL